jgi:hypothetical protein
VTLFWKALESLEGVAELEEIGYWGYVPLGAVSLLGPSLSLSVHSVHCEVSSPRYMPHHHDVLSHYGPTINGTTACGL